MAQILPRDLTAAESVASDAAVIIDSGSAVLKATPEQILDAAGGVKETDLAATTGSTLIGTIQSATGAVARTVQDELRETIKVTQFGAAGDNVADDTAEMQAAFDSHDASTEGAFEVLVPRGKYAVTGTGSRILEAQGGLGIRGTGTLEGSQIWADATADYDAALEDDGSAAKVEITNVTINCQDNTNPSAIIRLGVRDIQFGTYGYVHNVTARNAPNATAFDFDTNIVAVGILNSINTRDGVVNADGGVGLYAQAIYPIGATRYGQKMSLGDVTAHTEVEAPGADAVPIFQNRGGYTVSAIISQGPGTANKRLASYNPTYKAGADIGHLTVIQASGSTWGDFAAPAESGTATSVGTNTLTDTSKDWALNQWVGAGVKITSGTGVGTWAIVESNSNDTITLRASAWSVAGTAPVTGSGYALDYPVQAGSEVDGVWTRDASKIGHGVALNGLTFARALFQRVRAMVAEFNTLKVGSRGSVKDQEIYFEATVDFASIAANSVGTAVTVTVPGLTTTGKWVIDLTLPDTQAAQGFVITPAISATNTLKLYPKNLTAGAIDPASFTLRGVARRYA